MICSQANCQCKAITENNATRQIGEHNHPPMIEQEVQIVYEQININNDPEIVIENPDLAAEEFLHNNLDEDNHLQRENDANNVQPEVDADYVQPEEGADQVQHEEDAVHVEPMNPENQCKNLLFTN